MTTSYQIKVTLSNYALQVRGLPYRIISLDGNKSLYNLAESILESFDFEMDHSFGFYDNMKDTYVSKEGYELFTDIALGEDFPGVKKTKVKDVYNTLKKKMLFFFDYGDSWHFITQVISVKESKDAEFKTEVIKSVGEAPEQYTDWDDE